MAGGKQYQWNGLTTRSRTHSSTTSRRACRIGRLLPLPLFKERCHESKDHDQHTDRVDSIDSSVAMVGAEGAVMAMPSRERKAVSCPLKQWNHEQKSMTIALTESIQSIPR